MPFHAHPRHKKKFKPRPDLRQRLDEIGHVLQVLRDLSVHEKTKKKLIDRALWLVAELSGDFSPRYRSDGVLRNPGMKVQRDHIYPRKMLIAEILSEGADFGTVIERSICCLVTEEEHKRLSAVPSSVTGWERYKQASVVVRDMSEYDPENEA